MTPYVVMITSSLGFITICCHGLMVLLEKRVAEKKMVSFIRSGCEEEYYIDLEEGYDGMDCPFPHVLGTNLVCI